MPDNSKIYEAIEALGKDRGATATGKTKKVTVTLPVDLIDMINHYRQALGYSTFSASLKAIIEAYFNSLVKD